MSQARVLLTTIGSSGDVNPFLAIGSALIARGHRVTMLVNPYFEAPVRAAGMDFEPLGEAIAPHELIRQNPRAVARIAGPFVLIRQWLAPAMREMYVRTLRLARSLRPDVIVGHQIAFGAAWAAERCRVARVTVVLAPATLISAHSPSVMPTTIDPTRAPAWYRRFHGWAMRFGMGVILDGALNPIRRSLGIAPERDTMFGQMLAGPLVLGMWPAEFRGLQPDDPAGLRLCGFPWHDRSALHGAEGQTLGPHVERFLEAGEPPVVFTLGSVLSHGGVRAFRAAVGACEAIGRRGVLVVGSSTGRPERLPKGVIALDYAPYSQLFARGAATVHHGGVGTTAQALRAGRPQVIIPHAHDQFDNAARVQRLGAGRWLPLRRATADGMGDALRRVLGDRATIETAATLGRLIAPQDGAMVAAAHIEGLALGAGGSRGAASPGEARARENLD